MEAEFHVGADVECTDSRGGKLRQIIVDRASETVTHLVVDAEAAMGAPVLVPRDRVLSANRDRVRLSCTKDELAAMDRFEQAIYVAPEVQHPTLGYEQSDYLFPATWAAASFGAQRIPPAVPPVVEERVPEGEAAIGRDAVVEASDGEVGHVEELVSDPNTGKLSHLVVRTGHLWTARSIQVPASAIEAVEDGTVRLHLTRQQLEAGAEARE